MLFSESLGNMTLPNRETFLLWFITFKMLLFITKFKSSSIYFLFQALNTKLEFWHNFKHKIVFTQQNLCYPKPSLWKVGMVQLKILIKKIQLKNGTNLIYIVNKLQNWHILPHLSIVFEKACENSTLLGFSGLMGNFKSCWVFMEMLETHCTLTIWVKLSFRRAHRADV